MNDSKFKSLLSSQARVQVPWIKVTIGDYTFGIFDDQTKTWNNNAAGFYDRYEVQYPQYMHSLNVIKINGQVNTYRLEIYYPVSHLDDPNFFEKVFSSVSKTRKIMFTYGDAEHPAYIYKNEEAIITSISQSFNLPDSVIQYTIQAVSSAALATDGNITMPAPGKKVKPSEVIKDLFKSNKSLQDTFTGMSAGDLNSFIAGDDAEVLIESKINISAIDYINYLAGCMIPSGTTPGLSKDIYILTFYDDTVSAIDRGKGKGGPYFKITKTSTVMEHSEAYQVDIGVNTSTIVRNFQIEHNDNYSIYYDYQNVNHPEQYTRRLNNEGEWEDVFAPTSMIRNNKYDTKASDQVWWTKVTQFPINATITIQGLLRPATLMQYLRLNVVFPGGRKHLASGLYIVTRQVDNIDASGYTTQLSLTRINGDTEI
jgi:hypothetical protein